MKCLFLATMCLLSVASAFGSDKVSTSHHYTKTRLATARVSFYSLNGYAWRESSPEQRVSLAAGITAGKAMFLAFALASENKQIRDFGLDRYKATHVEKIETKDLADQIDLFYADPANRRIPIFSAYLYAVAKTKGSPAQYLQEMVEGMRREYNR
jgi:hypothetical protein